MAPPGCDELSQLPATLATGPRSLLEILSRYTLGLLLVVAMCLHADQNLAAPNLTHGRSPLMKWSSGVL